VRFKGAHPAREVTPQRNAHVFAEAEVENREGQILGLESAVVRKKTRLKTTVERGFFVRIFSK